MFKTDLRQGVVNSQYEETEEFKSWACEVLKGECVIIHEALGHRVCFEHEEDLIAYALAWSEPFQLPKFVIPKFRRVMPTIMVNDIMGVSPMSAPKFRTPRVINPKEHK